MSSSDSQSLPPVAEAQPLQPGSWSMQVTVQTPQVLGQSFMTARGLRSHSPLSCQMAHLVREMWGDVGRSRGDITAVVPDGAPGEGEGKGEGEG